MLHDITSPGFCAGSHPLRGTLLPGCRTWSSPTCNRRVTEPAEEQMQEHRIRPRSAGSENVNAGKFQNTLVRPRVKDKSSQSLGPLGRGRQ